MSDVRKRFLIHFHSIFLQYPRNVFLERCYESIIHSEEIEYQSSCMEPLTIESIFGRHFFIGFLISVDFVSDNRVADGGHMDTDLVSSSREKFDFEERIFVIDILNKFEFCLGKLGIYWVFGGHFLTVIWVPSDEGFNHSFLIFHQSENHGIVEFLNLPVSHFLLEFFHRTIILRYENESARVFIKPMNNPRTLDSVNNGKISEMIEKGIYKRSCISKLAWNCMCIHTRILTYDCEIRIIENNLQIHIFCLEVWFFCFKFDFENISFFHTLITLHGFSIHLKSSFFYELLHIRTRMLRKKGR